MLLWMKKMQRNILTFEVFPPAILGAGASIIPYPEHNQSPRNTYESAMAKQSLGFSTPMMNTSTYVRQHFMLYPQVPIVNTKAMKLLGFEKIDLQVRIVLLQYCHLMVTTLKMQSFSVKLLLIEDLGRTFFFRIYDAEAKQYPGGMRDNFDDSKR